MHKVSKLKIKATYLAILMLILIMLPQSATAANGVILEATEVAGGAGDEAIVTINAENAAGTEGGQFILTFDPDLVRPLSVEPGALITAADSNMHMANLEYAPGQLMFMWVTVMADTAESGPLCTITFELLAEGFVNLDFEEVIIVPEEIGLASAGPGEIRIGAVEPEPANGVDPEPDADVADEVTVNEETEAASGVNPVLIIALIALAVLLTVVAFIFRKPKKKKRKSKSK